MATWVIGDVHGQFRALMALFDEIDLGTDDEVWFVGDLVNRGPRSADVVRWAMQNDHRVVCVLGNHDAFALACSLGLAKPRKKDRLDDLLTAPDRVDLLDWLRRRPLLYRRGTDVLVHAGLLPDWSIDQALDLGERAADELRSDRAHELLSSFQKKRALPRRWSEVQGTDAEIPFAFNAMINIRCLSSDGAVDLSYKGPPRQAPAPLVPWFRLAERPARVFFGHWAALGLRFESGCVGLDSGAAWEGNLSAFCADDGRLAQVSVRRPD